MKILLSIIALITISFNIAKADVTETTNKTAKGTSDLTKQYKQEIKTKLSLPVNLKFDDNNLKGFATAYLEVLPSGKINLIRVEGDNNSLNGHVQSKINSINAWTDKELAGKTFRYIIKVN